MELNKIMLSDSYKYSHKYQYPKGMTFMYDYMEARSTKVFPKTVFVGLQGKLNVLTERFTKEEVEEASIYAKAHGIPFPYDDWMYIVNELEGKLPVRIKAVKEGSLVDNKNILMSIESTDSKVAWIVGWTETYLMKLWYESTIATKSFYIKKILTEYSLETTGSDMVDFSFHNFGDRGSSSVESASIAGFAHLTQFKGTDNFHSLKYCKENYYEGYSAGFSIPATEHSTVTSWGKSGRFEMYENFLETHKNYPIIACVMDSYNIYEDVDWLTSSSIKDKIESDDYPIFVIRPDSGNPVDVLRKLIDIIEINKVFFPY